jgi:hypothetical protein
METFAVKVTLSHPERRASQSAWPPILSSRLWFFVTGLLLGAVRA